MFLDKKKAKAFISEIINLKCVSQANIGAITAISVTISNIVLSKSQYNRHIQPILDKYTDEHHTAQLVKFVKKDPRDSEGQEYYYDIQLFVNSEEKE